MEDVEKLYSPSQWCFKRCIPELVVQKHVETVIKESLKVKKEIKFIENVRYGNKPKQLLDIFEPLNVSSDTPTFIYIHGGYWQELCKDISRYCVKPLLKANIRVIIVGYDLAPDVTMETIVSEIEDLGKFIQNMAKKCNWKNIWYAGHSAGAHLAASLLCSKISSELYISGFVLISGIYNLEPLIHTSINKKLNITNENWRSLSPLIRISSTEYKNIQTLIIVAEFDSPAFQEQSAIFKQEMEKQNFKVTMQIISDTDHFSVVENLKDDDYKLTKMIIDTLTSTE